ncbi:MAG: hypothetical protein AAGH19_11635 [Pseudomonadota bacterium]
MNRSLKTFVATLPLALAACATPTMDSSSQPQSSGGLGLEGPPYGNGPVELFIDGTASSGCEWRLIARYATDTAPHAIDIRQVYTDGRDGRVLAESGTAEYLPNDNMDMSRLVDGAVETELWSWSEPMGCADIKASIMVGECYEAPCPRYVAGESRVPVMLEVSAP